MLFDDAGGLERVDNVSEFPTLTALRAFRVQYADTTITKGAIFDYVYGILHAPEYRVRFTNDLAKELPRIPFAPGFWDFAEAGREPAGHHFGYESGPQYPLDAVAAHGGAPTAEDFRIGQRAMRFVDDEKTALIVNDRLRLTGIPAKAREFVVTGRTPLEWQIDRYRIARDRESGIFNDPNAWFDDREAARAARSSPVAAARVSERAKRKVDRKRTGDGRCWPVKNFATLMDDLATLTLNSVPLPGQPGALSPMLAEPPPLQARALAFLEIKTETTVPSAVTG